MGGLLLMMLMLSANHGPASAEETDLPCQIAVSSDGPAILAAVSTSPTFQQQCRRLADAQIVVVVRWALDITPLHHAETRILRSGGRVFRAVVSLRVSDEPAVQLIHEIEHIIEAIEGIDHRSAACSWRTPAGAYETARAKRVESTARQELRSNRSPSLSVGAVGGPSCDRLAFQVGVPQRSRD